MNPPLLVSKQVRPLGRVHYPLGAGSQLADLVGEIDEYFQHGISVSPGDVVFDVGANIGAFALHASRRAEGLLEIFCFEPIPPVYHALSRNLSTSPLSGRVKKHLHQVGLTSFAGPKRATFHYFKRLPCDTTQHLEEKVEEFNAYFEQKGRKFHEHANRIIGIGPTVGTVVDRVVSRIATNPVTRALFDRALGMTKLECSLTTIQAVVEENRVEKIDLLKVDVEGAELEVLQGIGPTTWPKIRQVVMEGHDRHGRLERIKGLLREAGFGFIQSEVPPLAIERGLNNFILHARRV